MKTEKEIRESIEGCIVKIQENRDTEALFTSTLTPQAHGDYERTRNYIKGWIDSLQRLPRVYKHSSEYNTGYENAAKWRNN